MKKNLFILGIAALAFAACSNDEVVEVNQGEAISFRPLVNNVTRAVAKTAFATSDVIDVYADYNGSKSFQDNFTKLADGNFTSTTKHYWPSDIGTGAPAKAMTFTAFYGAEQSSTTAGSLAATYTPDAAASDQTDLLFAKHSTTEKEVPVVLNFRHMLSQINVLVKNTNNGISAEITGVRIGYVKTSGTFAYSGDATDTKNSGKLNQNTWTPTDFTAPGSGETYANNYKYDQTVSKTINGTADAGTLTSYVPWMLIPQNMAGSSTQYQNTKADGDADDIPDLGGAYIALKMTIYNWNGSARGAVIAGEQWCSWPITTVWRPG